jgi:hypothetical protein
MSSKGSANRVVMIAAGDTRTVMERPEHSGGVGSYTAPTATVGLGGRSTPCAAWLPVEWGVPG